MIAYKIMKYSNKFDDRFQTLFHGIDGSKHVPLDTWLEAEQKWCIDGSGGTRYLSGIHVLPSYLAAMDYMENFSDPTDKVIVMCEVKDYHKKAHARDEVYLARKCRIMGEVTPPDDYVDPNYICYDELVS
jgi:hypothetical protein